MPDLDEAIRRNPKSRYDWANRGSAWRELGDFAKSSADLDEALRLDPQYVYALHSRGITRMREDKLDLAIADFSAALAIRDRDKNALVNRGDCWRLKKDLDQALADYDAALRIDPKSTTALVSRGMLWRARKDEKKTLADWDEALRIDPKMIYVYTNRATLRYEQGNFAATVADYEEALRIDAKNTFALARLPHARKMRDLDRRLADLQAEKLKPAPAERAEIADACGGNARFYLTGLKLFDQAFAADPALADDVAKARRSQAARLALRAVAAAAPFGLADAEKAKARQKALAWMRADLASLIQRTKDGTGESVALADSQLADWQNDNVLAPIREAKPTAPLPIDEAGEWQKFWAEVAEFRGQLASRFMASTIQDKITASKLEFPHDVKMPAGTLFIIEMKSKEFDSYLKLLDPTGKLAMEHDDIPINQDARLVFRAKTGGVYRIVATSCEGLTRGAFTLTIRSVSDASPRTTD